MVWGGRRAPTKKEQEENYSSYPNVRKRLKLLLPDRPQDFLVAVPAPNFSCKDLQVGCADLALAAPADEDVLDDALFCFVEFYHCRLSFVVYRW